MPVRQHPFKLPPGLCRRSTPVSRRSENLGRPLGRDDLMAAWMHQISTPEMHVVRTMAAWPLRRPRSCVVRPADPNDQLRAAPKRPVLSLIFSNITR